MAHDELTIRRMPGNAKKGAVPSRVFDKDTVPEAPRLRHDHIECCPGHVVEADSTRPTFALNGS
jgi:hypothetical protein